MEGAFAFNAAVKRLTGKDIPGYFKPGSSDTCVDRFCAISAGQSSYANANQSFNNKCFPSSNPNESCDFVALLLEPTEAEHVMLPWPANLRGLLDTAAELDMLARVKGDAATLHEADTIILRRRLNLTRSEVTLLQSAATRLQERRFGRA